MFLNYRSFSNVNSWKDNEYPPCVLLQITATMGIAYDTLTLSCYIWQFVSVSPSHRDDKALLFLSLRSVSSFHCLSRSPCRKQAWQRDLFYSLCCHLYLYKPCRYICFQSQFGNRRSEVYMDWSGAEIEQFNTRVRRVTVASTLSHPHVGMQVFFSQPYPLTPGEVLTAFLCL